MTQRIISHFFGLPLVGDISQEDILQLIVNMEGASGVTVDSLFVNSHTSSNPQDNLHTVGMLFLTEEKRAEFKASKEAREMYEAFGSLAMTQVSPTIAH